MSRSIRMVDQRLRFFVVEAYIRPDDRTAYFIFKYARVRKPQFSRRVARHLEREDDRHAEFVFSGAERAEVVAEFLGQHGQNAVNEIDGRTAAVGIVVNFCPRADIMGHIRDMHPDTEGR